MSFFDPAKTAAAKRDAEYEEDQQIPPLNPPFPWRMQTIDPIELGLLKDAPKPIDNGSQPT